ncbi:hypothetical protein CTA1_12794 [Colletotrichum tanaceti]|uniref:Uncharacterized protein n=1 Tax=Colletotrichum tanaceti TaxID=1306861 RepID=A0A4U6XHE4_9PEZI|nr:hypothetical protein CTA1_12794 [Colletotrichum tanaceti]
MAGLVFHSNPSASPRNSAASSTSSHRPVSASLLSDRKMMVAPASSKMNSRRHSRRHCSDAVPPPFAFSASSSRFLRSTARNATLSQRPSRRGYASRIRVEFSRTSGSRHVMATTVSCHASPNSIEKACAAERKSRCCSRSRISTTSLISRQYGVMEATAASSAYFGKRVQDLEVLAAAAAAAASDVVVVVVFVVVGGRAVDRAVGRVGKRLVVERLQGAAPLLQAGGGLFAVGEQLRLRLHGLEDAVDALLVDDLVEPEVVDDVEEQRAELGDAPLARLEPRPGVVGVVEGVRHGRAALARVRVPLDLHAVRLDGVAAGLEAADELVGGRAAPLDAPAEDSAALDVEVVVQVKHLGDELPRVRGQVPDALVGVGARQQLLQQDEAELDVLQRRVPVAAHGLEGDEEDGQQHRLLDAGGLEVGLALQPQRAAVVHDGVLVVRALQQVGDGREVAGDDVGALRREGPADGADADGGVAQGRVPARELGHGGRPQLGAREGGAAEGHAHEVVPVVKVDALHVVGEVERVHVGFADEHTRAAASASATATATGSAMARTVRVESLDLNPG